MGTTSKTILVNSTSIAEVMDISRGYLLSNRFKIKELRNGLIGTRGLGFFTAQQRFILRFSPRDNQTVEIQGEFLIVSLYFLKNTVAEKAVMGAIPRRTGHRLMMQYISRINGQVS